MFKMINWKILEETNFKIKIIWNNFNPLKRWLSILEMAHQVNLIFSKKSYFPKQD